MIARMSISPHIEPMSLSIMSSGKHVYFSCGRTYVAMLRLLSSRLRRVRDASET